MTIGTAIIPEIKNILFATDLSENARYALKYAYLIANRFEAAITILHVLEDLSPSFLGMVIEIVGKNRWLELKKRNEEKIISAISARIDDMCKETWQSTPECPLIVQKIIVKTGHPVDRIMQYAGKEACDLVVVGSRGHGTLSEARLGSTSRRVLRQCRKPVLVVHLPQSDIHDFSI